MDWTNQLGKVNNKFKFQLFGRNVQNLDACYSNINKFDEKYQGTMTEHAFNLYLNSFGVYLTLQEIRTIKENFATQNSQIRYIDFIQNVRDDVSPKRLATIDHAWDELSNGDVIQIQALLDRFDANNHPHARCQLKHPQKIYDEFQHSIKNRSADKKNLNSIQFKQYYLDVNACVPAQRQEYFVDMIIKGLRLDDSRVSIDRIRQMEVVLYEKLRQKTYFKTDQGQKLQKMFRFFDMEDKGVIDFKRFMSVLDKLGCNFLQKQTKALYQKHARQDLLFSYEQFCGMMFSMGSGLKDNTNPIFQLAKKDGLVTTQGMSKRLN